MSKGDMTVADVLVTDCPRLDATFSHDAGTIRVESPEPITVEQALALANVDTVLWEVAKVRTGSWHTTMKIKRKGVGDTPLQVRNNMWEITVRRKIGKDIEEALNMFADRLKVFSPRKFPKPPVRVNEAEHVAELALIDHHFGKLAWRKETLEDFDLEIARRLYDSAIEDHIEWIAPFNIESFLLPIGHDFLHVNDDTNETPTAHNALDVDGRSAKIFAVGAEALVLGIERLRAIAPVRLVFVPGNHDRDINYYLATAMKLAFRNDDRVSMDIEPCSRKYWEYGNVLLGMTHMAAKGMKPERLAAIMAGEQKAAWARTTHHEWHVGHTHRAQTYDSMPLKEELGVRVRTLPCLTGTDKWHFDQGFVLNWRASEMYLWHREDGYRGHFSINARRS